MGTLTGHLKFRTQLTIMDLFNGTRHRRTRPHLTRLMTLSLLPHNVWESTLRLRFLHPHHHPHAPTTRVPIVKLRLFNLSHR